MSKSVDLLDANVWLALAFEAHSQHLAAKNYWEGSAAATAAFCRVTQMTFLRLLTNRTVMGVHVLSTSAAWKKSSEFLALPEIQLVDEPHGIEDDWERFSKTGRSSPNLWTDAYLAAFAHSSGFRLVTFDKGFSKFDGLDCLILRD